MTSTFTTATTFTRTHAKHLAAKVVADLYQCALFYDRPSKARIPDYETELIEMLANEYIYTYEFGFKVGEKRLLSWHYTVGADGGLHGDSNAGAIYAKADVAQSTYFNFLTPSNKWNTLTAAQQSTFENTMPFQRGEGSSPIDGDGYWQTDHGYTAGGVRVYRKTFRPR